MSFENQIHLLDVTRITIHRDERQRSSVEDDADQKSLIDSIRRNGLINPIIVRLPDEEGDPILVAGERRLRAFKAIGHDVIPSRYAHELDPIEAAIIELEENIARKDLTWQDTARAVCKLHELHVTLDPEWSQARTSEAVSLTPGIISRYLRLSKYFNDTRIMEAQTINRAEGMISVLEGRQREAAYNALFEASDEEDDEEDIEGTTPQPQEAVEGLPPASAGSPDNGDTASLDAFLSERPLIRDIDGATAPAPESLVTARAARSAVEAILHQSFLDWAPSYSGRRFNFIHVDFPYGAEEVGPQMRGNEATIYDDSPEIYISLLNCFCDNLDRFMARAGWIVFWYSERMGQITKETFKYKAPSLTIQHHPLIWLHSDNAGISPDHTRYPRHIYDTALLMSRGSFPLVRMKADAYACPTDRRLHPSTKPEPMLKFFFEMFIDEHTSLLDPTCGSGSSLRAAEALGCKRVLGMDANSEYVETSRKELQDRRNMHSFISSYFDAPAPTPTLPPAQ